MNPVLIMLILIGCVGLWFLLSNVFKTVGQIMNIFADDAKNAMFDKENDNEKS